VALLKEKPLLQTQMEVIRRGFATKQAVNHIKIVSIKD
jgi:hypothetical protein